MEVVFEIGPVMLSAERGNASSWLLPSASPPARHGTKPPARQRPPLETDPLGEFRVGVCCRRKSLDNPLVAAFWESTATAARLDDTRTKPQRASVG